MDMQNFSKLIKIMQKTAQQARGMLAALDTLGLETPKKPKRKPRADKGQPRKPRVVESAPVKKRKTKPLPLPPDDAFDAE